MTPLKLSLLLLALFLSAGCGKGAPSPEDDDPPTMSSEEMSDDEIASERALGAPPKE